MGETIVKKMRLSGFAVKRVAVISMIVDHVCGFIIRPYYMERFHIITSEAQAHQSMRWYYLIESCDAIGSIAFPLFCFLLAEGFLHSRNRLKYALRLTAFALISEIPFNLVHNGTVFFYGLQNVMFTLATGIFTLYAASLAENRLTGGKKLWFARIAITAAGMGAALLIKGEYVFLGVLAVSLFYYLREYRWLKFLSFAPLIVPSVWSLLAVIPILLYNGARGKGSKYFFYIFYPAHFLLIYLLVTMHVFF